MVEADNRVRPGGRTLPAQMIPFALNGLRLSGSPTLRRLSNCQYNDGGLTGYVTSA